MEWWQPGLHQLSDRDGWTRGTYPARIRLPSFSLRELRLIFRRAFSVSLRSILYDSMLLLPSDRDSRSGSLALTIRVCPILHGAARGSEYPFPKTPLPSWLDVHPGGRKSFHCLNCEITRRVFIACRSGDHGCYVQPCNLRRVPFD